MPLGCLNVAVMGFDFHWLLCLSDQCLCVFSFINSAFGFIMGSIILVVRACCQALRRLLASLNEFA